MPHVGNDIIALGLVDARISEFVLHVLWTFSALIDQCYGDGIVNGERESGVELTLEQNDSHTQILSAASATDSVEMQTQFKVVSRVPSVERRRARVFFRRMPFPASSKTYGRSPKESMETRRG